MFNKDSRTKNVIKSSLTGTIINVINLLAGFIYRTVFIHFLSSSYLGISGLFANVLQILSFAELGLGTVISFRLYQPILLNDTNKVGRLMNFYRKVYVCVAAIVAAAGLSVYPFLNYFIKDASEIPADVNINFVYLLYLFNCVSSYVYVTPQTLLVADQKQYKYAIFQGATKLCIYLVQFAILVLMRSYTITLISGIVTTLVCNVAISTYVKRQYPEVFAVKGSISKQERDEIFGDTKAMLCHKVGATALESTDSLILSSFVGIVSTGIYSNYNLIITSVNSFLTQIFGSYIASLGNTHFSLDADKSYKVYKRLLFANFWIAGMCTVCLFILIDDFIKIWIGEKMLFSSYVTVVFCVQFYLGAIRHISMAYTTGSGLFNRDIARPFIEAIINVIVSILLVIKIGIAGVFIGTIISHLLTVIWREPLLLYRYEFKRPVKEYWMMFSTFTALTLLLAVLIYRIKVLTGFICGNIFLWLLEAMICILIYNLALAAIFVKNEDFKFYVQTIKQFINRKLKKA